MASFLVTHRISAYYWVCDADMMQAAEQQQMPSPAVGPGSSSRAAPDEGGAEEATPAGSLQQTGRGLHVGMSAYSGGSTGPHDTPWSAGSDPPQGYSVPRFHEMEVSTGLKRSHRCTHDHFNPSQQDHKHCHPPFL